MEKNGADNANSMTQEAYKTFWADQAFQISGQDAYDKVMNLNYLDRRAAFINIQFAEQAGVEPDFLV